MAILFDESKPPLNLERHGFDFVDFATEFDASDAVFSETAPSRTGRELLRVIGRWSNGRLVTAIVSPLGSEAWSLVSLRIASSEERDVHVQRNATG